MVGGDDSGHLIDGLPLTPVLGCAHTDRRCGHRHAALPGGDGDGGEGSTFVLAGGLVSNGFVGPALAGEYRVLGFDVLGGKSCRRDSDELAEELPAEHAVVLQSLIAALQLGHGVVGALLSGAPRRHRMKIKTFQEIGPEIGHSLSVSPVLRQ